MSLLTLLLSVPLIIIIHIIIDNYASRWPGSRGFEDDITEEMIKEKAKKKEEDTKRSKNKDAASMLWNSACKSEFGEVVKSSAPGKASSGVDAQVEISQMAYAGKPAARTKSVTLLVFLLHDMLTYDRVISHVLYFISFLPHLSSIFIHLMILESTQTLLHSRFLHQFIIFYWCTLPLFSLSTNILTILTSRLFQDFTTVAEESLTIMERVHSFLFFNNENDKWLPWEVLKVTDIRSQARGAKIEAIDEQLGIQPNGSFLPLTLRQRLLFKTPLKKLEYKVGKVRLKSKEIIEEIESLKPWESDMKDKKLMRYFILECLGPFKRFAFEQNNQSYDNSTARRPSWTMYIISWAFVTSVLCFYIYWILAWGLYNGEKTLAAWGIVYALSAANDILLVQVTKIFILYYLPAMAMQPQLLRIRKVLADICMAYVNRTDPDGADTATEEVDTLSVVQYMSATCRASRSHEMRKLPASWLFRQVKQMN